MDVQTDPSTQTKTDSTLTDHPQSEDKKPSLVIRVLKNPLFLVIFTWVIMAFLLAFEVSGK